MAPNLPTVAQTLPGFEALQWFGLLMPAGTTAEIVSRLNAETVKILKRRRIVPSSGMGPASQMADAEDLVLVR